MSKQNRVAHASPLPAGIVELSVHRPPHISHATPDFLAEEVPVAGLQRYFACGDDGLAERSGAVRHRFSLSEGIIAHPQDLRHGCGSCL